MGNKAERENPTPSIARIFSLRAIDLEKDTPVSDEAFALIRVIKD